MKSFRGVVVIPFLVLMASAVAHGGAIEKHARFGVTFHYQDYAAVLSKYVDESGMVDYAGLKDNREQLDFFVRDVSGLYRDIYDEWPEKERVAYWINAYNAITLQSIINNYPEKAKNRGIRGIPKVWKAKVHTAKGEMVSLDGIEHEYLRKEFSEPRIHVALVCAAQSCPPLRNEPYRSETLDEQLDDQVKTFLANPKWFKIDSDEKVIYLSKILQWYGKDWVSSYKDKAFTSYGSDTEKAVLAFIAEYLDDAQRESLKSDTYRIKYLRYDWALNDQAASK